ncbi:hypothetical protein MNEG_16386, partial [Monoraphidium neglectum]
RSGWAMGRRAVAAGRTRAAALAQQAAATTTRAAARAARTAPATAAPCGRHLLAPADAARAAARRRGGGTPATPARAAARAPHVRCSSGWCSSGARPSVSWAWPRRAATAARPRIRRLGKQRRRWPSGRGR